MKLVPRPFFFVKIFEQSMISVGGHAMGAGVLAGARTGAYIDVYGIMLLKSTGSWQLIGYSPLLRCIYENKMAFSPFRVVQLTVCLIFLS